jgi:hypothetical protein
MSSFKHSVHLAVAVFDGGRVVFRDTLLYSSAIRRWSGTAVGGVAVPAAARGASPIPSPERAHVSLTVLVSGQLRCTLVGWKTKPLHIVRQNGEENVRALRFERVGLGFQNAARVDVFADRAAPASADDATHTWRVSALVKMDDAFLNELLFP